MRLALVVAIGLLASGCDSHHRRLPAGIDASEARDYAVHPAGRYQMVQTGPNTVAVLDTRYGSVKACAVEAGTIIVSCGVESGAAR